MTTHDIDTRAAEEFAGRMLEILNDGALALMVSVGHRLRLFDTLATLPPSTSDAIARRAGLQERYVREWLAAMVSGRLVDYDPSERTYALPGHRAACLTEPAGPENLARTAQFISLLGEVEQRIVDCFRRGGGVGYDAYPRFHDLMAQESAAVHDAALIDGILPLVSGLPAQLERGIDVLDIGCGHGHAVNLMAQAFPRSRITGMDIAASAIDAGRAEAGALGLKNAHHEICDVAALDASADYDLITAFDAIHDQAAPARVLANAHRALRPGGRLLMVDFAASSRLENNLDHFLAPFLYTVSCMHCTPVSLADDGAGLGTMWGEEKACAMLREAGFADVSVERLDSDPLNNYYVAAR